MFDRSRRTATIWTVMGMAALLQPSCYNYTHCGDATLKCSHPLVGFADEEECDLASPWVDLSQRLHHRFVIDNLPALPYLRWGLEFSNVRGDAKLEIAYHDSTARGTWVRTISISDILREKSKVELSDGDTYDLFGNAIRLRSHDLTVSIDIVGPAKSGTVRMTAYGSMGIPNDVFARKAAGPDTMPAVSSP
jgi:hypothetical protein